MLNHFVIRRLIQAHHSINRRRPWQLQLIPLPIPRVQNRARRDEIRPNRPSLLDNLISSHLAGKLTHPLKRWRLHHDDAVARKHSAIDLAEADIERADDRRDIGQHVSPSK